MGSIVDNDYEAPAAPEIKARAERELLMLEAAARDVQDEGPAPDAGPQAQTEAEAAADAMILDLLSTLAHTAFRVLAPAWEVEKVETDLLAQAWGPVLDEYLPGWGDSPIGLALVATAGIIAPRLGKPRHKQPIQGAAREVPDQEPPSDLPKGPAGWGQGGGRG